MASAAKKANIFTRMFSQAVKKEPVKASEVAQKILTTGKNPVIHNTALVDAVRAEQKAVSKNFRSARGAVKSAQDLVKSDEAALKRVDTTRTPVNESALEYNDLQQQIADVNKAEIDFLADEQGKFTAMFPKYKANRPTKAQKAALDQIEKQRSAFTDTRKDLTKKSEEVLKRHEEAATAHDHAKQLAPTAEVQKEHKDKVTAAITDLDALRPERDRVVPIARATQDAARRAGYTFSDPGNLESNTLGGRLASRVVGGPLGFMTTGMTSVAKNGEVRAWGIGPTLSNAERLTGSLLGRATGIHLVPGSDADAVLKAVSSRYVNGTAAGAGLTYWVGTGIHNALTEDSKNTGTISSDTVAEFSKLKGDIYALQQSGVLTPEQFQTAKKMYYDNFSDDGTDNIGYTKSGVSADDYGTNQKILRDLIVSSPAAKAYAQQRAAEVWDSKAPTLYHGKYSEFRGNPRNQGYIDKFHRDVFAPTAANGIEQDIFTNYVNGGQ